MTADIIVRILGFIVFGIIGWLVGTILAGTSDLNVVSLRYILPLAVVGGALGAFVAPWLTTRPAAAMRNVIGELTAAQLVAAIIGLVVGLVIAALAAIPLSYLPYPFRSILPTVVVIVFGYLGITIAVLRQRDITALFRRRGTGASISPLVGAQEDGTHRDALLLDTSVIIDGRIADIALTGFIRSPMLIPRFVLAELQYIADSPDSLRRNRGRRGLEMLNKMQKDSPAPVQVVDLDVEGTRQVDAKLVQLARQLSCPIVTNDYNLNRVAGLQEIEVTVTKVLQTSAGRMIFATPNV
jgi:uncharacterized protein YacL